MSQETSDGIFEGGDACLLRSMVKTYGYDTITRWLVESVAHMVHNETLKP